MNRLHVRVLIVAIPGFLFALLGTVPASAMEQNSKSRLTWDFDGDHKTDLAVGGVSDSTFTLRLQFSGQPDRILLTTKVARQIALNLLAVDVDRDNDIDLVLTGFSFRPVAVWFNQGKGKFKDSSPWFFPPLYGETGGQVGRTSPTSNTAPVTAVERPSVFFLAAWPFAHIPRAEHDYFSPVVRSFVNLSFRKASSRGPPL